MLEHLDRVRAVAKRIQGYYELQDLVLLEDLISAGTIGLLQAADRWNPELGVDFGAYAQLRIRGAMIDWLRSSGDRLPPALGSAPGAHGSGVRYVGLARVREPRYREDFDSPLDRSKLFSLAVAHIERLPPRRRAMMLAKYVDDMPDRAVAAIYGVSESCVEGYTWRALKTLRRMMGHLRPLWESLP